jgi:hypothetical protein
MVWDKGTKPNQTQILTLLQLKARKHITTPPQTQTETLR